MQGTKQLGGKSSAKTAAKLSEPPGQLVTQPVPRQPDAHDVCENEAE